MEKTNCRCTDCGFIRYNTTVMDVCPMCGNRDADRMVPSFLKKKEACCLFCEALNISMESYEGKQIQQALDIIMMHGY